jgi:hypothetical protein
MFLPAPLVGCAVLYSQEKKPNMKHYCLIFHTSRTLTPEELKQRRADITAWVKQVEEMGVTLDPRAFGETAAMFSREGGSVVSRQASSDPALTNLVFFDCEDPEKAVKIGRAHPGLHYGAAVEVREWSSPRAAVAGGV